MVGKHSHLSYHGEEVVGHVCPAPENANVVPSTCSVLHVAWQIPFRFGWRFTKRFINFLDDVEAQTDPFIKPFQPAAMLEWFVVKSEWRRKGIGLHVLNNFVTKDSQRVVLITQSAANLRLYERAGFRVITKNALSTNGRECDNWCMVYEARGHGVAPPGSRELPADLAMAPCSFRHAYFQAAQTLQQSSVGDHPLRRLLLGLQDLQVAEEPAVPRPTGSSPGTDQYLLFFDGGSRGNPGAGGSGAVVIRVDAFGGRPRITWAAAMSLASPSTTNNQAEYFGLVTGLRFASKHRLQPLTVIGDSAMIITLRDHRSPKDQRLKRRYAEARILADVLGITHWRHHVRAFNKMADCAANLAMDSKASVQTLDPSTRPCWDELRTYLLEDVAQWQASTYPGPTSIS